MAVGVLHSHMVWGGAGEAGDAMGTETELGLLSPNSCVLCSGTDGKGKLQWVKAAQGPSEYGLC